MEATGSQEDKSCWARMCPGACAVPPLALPGLLFCQALAQQASLPDCDELGGGWGSPPRRQQCCWEGFRQAGLGFQELQGREGRAELGAFRQDFNSALVLIYLFVFKGTEPLPLNLPGSHPAYRDHLKSGLLAGGGRDWETRLGKTWV